MVKISGKTTRSKTRYRQVFLPIILCFLLTAHTARAIEIAQGDPAPDFTALTIDGRSVTLSQFQGNPVFVAFWSSWCSRCKEEMTFLKELQKSYPAVQFLAINSESENPDSKTLQRMEKAISDWGIPFTVLVDEGLRIWDLYGINALPTSFIVGSDGTIVFAEPNFYFASPENFENALLELSNPKIKYSQRESPSE